MFPLETTPSCFRRGQGGGQPTRRIAFHHKKIVELDTIS